MSSSSTYVVDYSADEIKKAHEVLRNEGLRMRIKVAGQDYVEKSLRASKGGFGEPMQEYVQEACWGWVSTTTPPHVPRSHRLKCTS